jgi:hypothetical protein
VSATVAAPYDVWWRAIVPLGGIRQDSRERKRLGKVARDEVEPLSRRVCCRFLEDVGQFLPCM